ncbi:MAG: hypothetical protein HYR84_10010 [Planctomycetes bacterium]|nr:hypothetical protein [Planctomycetota bacterium]
MHVRNLTFALALAAIAGLPAVSQQKKEELFLDPIKVNVPHISTDKSVKYDYDIVYVRTPRKGDKARSLWTEIAHPAIMDAQGDLMLLRPDGSEELLVAGGVDGSVTDPYVSFDGQWVFYSHLKGLKGTSQHGQPPYQGADIFKINVKTKKIVQLTHQEWTPNTGAARWTETMRMTGEKGKTWLNYGVLNMGPCPLPGGRLIFTSNRNAFKPPRHPSPTLQLFVMDDDGKNVEMIGHLNIGMALHPVTLKDGRVIFSSLESQGLRSGILWGLWIINPDGTNWGPVLSALLPGEGAPNAFHFQTQISSGHIIAEEYYNQNNSGFGGYYKLLPPRMGGYDEGYAAKRMPPAFGPAWQGDERNPPLRNGRHSNGRGKYSRLPFSPYGIESFTRFANFSEGPADPSVRDRKDSPAVGKFTHPSGAPDNHLLTCYTPGPANHQYAHYPMPDGGIYLIKDGKPIDEPAQMRLIKNDPKYNEQWPRAVVPYKRIFGVDEPRNLTRLANDGKLSKHLPEGTPYGLVGTSSFYKRESYPGGGVKEGSVTADYMGKNKAGYEGLDPFNTSENGASMNWVNQGADAGRYSNDDIHAVRILVMEPTTDRQQGYKAGRRFFSHAQERLRILGEIPLRHFKGEPGASATGGQAIDPDKNPDTSFLAKIPADVAFTFQTLDKRGMVLNMAQTWHQVRPGEIRNDCGGCHAHSQHPTPFESTAAAKESYPIFDLTTKTPLLTTRAKSESKQRWDVKNETGLRYVSVGEPPALAGGGGKGHVVNVEYHRDIKPLLDRSCVACHTANGGREPAGKLVLDDDKVMPVPNRPAVPGTYYRLAMDREAKFGHKPVIHNGQWRQTNVSRYIREFQSRRSLLIWKIYGERLDGWTNDDFPTEKVPGDANTLMWKGKAIANTAQSRNLADLDYLPPMCPPPEGKVPPLSDEEKRTFVRWIDLGCPIDLDFDPATPQARGYGWMLDDNRPTLTVTSPTSNANARLDRILVGMHDYDTGLDMKSFRVTADFAIDGVKAGENLASKFKSSSQGVWEYRLTTPITTLERGVLTVAVRDRQGNETRIVRTMRIGR